MKIQIIPFTITAAIAFLAVSCEKKETPADTPAVSETPAEVSQHEKFATQLMDKSHEVFDTVLEVKDLPSAQIAASKINKVAGEIDDIYKELNTLGAASAEVKAIIQEKLKEKDKEMLAKRVQVNQLMQSLPEDVTRVIVDAMMECSKVMESNKEVFEKCFGVK